jgi:hypothetical protein
MLFKMPRRHITKTEFAVAAFLGTLTSILILLLVKIASSAEIPYTLTPIKNEAWAPIAINDREIILIERQLTPGATPVPLAVNQNGKETKPFQCQGTTNDSIGEGLNNRGFIVGHCGHQPGFTVTAFAANARTGEVRLFNYPGSIGTWGFGINDSFEVVGSYYLQGDIRAHGFVWNAVTGEYKTLDHPTSAVGASTMLFAISSGGQIAGEFYDGRDFFPFIYDGVFMPLAPPGAFPQDVTFIGQSGDGRVFVSYSGPTCIALCFAIFDDGKFTTVSFEDALPDNARYPKNGFISKAVAFNFSSLNDNGEFVGSYQRILSWKPSIFEPGEFDPATTEIVNFVASPKKGGKN